ncbi:MAG: type II secretion system protein [Microthrixaceae bacterium]
MEMIEQRKRNRSQGGFTLVELLVVIAILAVLGGVAVFAVGNLGSEAGTSACEVERDTVITAANAAIAADGNDSTWATYVDGTPKYWSYTPTGTATAADPSFVSPAGSSATNCASL